MTWQVELWFGVPIGAEPGTGPRGWTVEAREDSRDTAEAIAAAYRCAGYDARVTEA